MNRLSKICAASALVLVLGGCALLNNLTSGTPEEIAVKSLAIACDTHGAFLETVTPLRAARKISFANIQRIDRSKEIVNKACDVGSTMDPALAITLVKGANEQLKVIIGSL